MLHPRATSAGLADTGAIVSLGGRDSLFPIRSASHAQRLTVSIQAPAPLEPRRGLAAADRAALKPLLAMAERLGASRAAAPT